MDHTPPNKIVRPRHTPTPKMSERKKALFSLKMAIKLPEVTEIIDEESDLGPMSPLQFSSSPTSYDSETQQSKGRFMRQRLDFKNIMGLLAPLNVEPKRDHPLTPLKDTQTPNGSPSSNRKLSPSQPHSPEMLTLEKENCSELSQKTPGESSTTASFEFPRISFRKSLIFDTGLTPDDHHVSPNTRKCVLKRSSLPDSVDDSPISSKLSRQSSFNENSKARASLSFTEQPVISAKTFYGSSFNESPPKRRETLKPVSQPQKRAKTTPVRRSNLSSKKSRSIHRPVLGSINKGVRHKIGKPKVQTKGKIVGLKSMTKAQILEAAIDLIGSRRIGYGVEKSSTSQGKTVIADDTQITREQIERLQKIMRNRRDPMEIASRPLNWSGSNKNLSATSTGESSGSANVSFASHNTQNSSDDEEPDDKTDAGAGRKFFKSKSSNKKTYSVINGLCATVKRGASMKLLSPKRKRQRNKQSDYDEFQEIQREVSDIIGMLGQSESPDVGNDTSATIDASATNETVSVVDKYEKYRQMIPYNTTDPEVQQRQENLLDLLITNDICTDENFKIFIMEPDLHKEEAGHILDQLIVIDMLSNDDQDVDIEYEVEQSITDAPSTVDDVPMSPASQISTMTLGLALGSPQSDKQSNQIDNGNSMESPSSSAKKLYPIFYRENFAGIEPLSPKKKLSINAKREESTLKKWKSIGDRQFQIDAGQSAFGGKMCKECEMFYSVHEPEDELMHQKYHNARKHLNFRGWQDERLVCNVPDWGSKGRIIYVVTRDTKQHINRVKEILGVVDVDLGYADTRLKPTSIVYLAIAKHEVVGVCVAETAKTAFRMVNENNIQCLDTSQSLPVKCGISRIWVVSSYRRCGIATRLMTAVRSHFVRGQTLAMEEIAFSAPTEMGRSFATHLTNNILVYENSD